MSAVDRVGIGSDMFALSIAGYTSTVEYLKLLAGYVEETDYTVWSDIVDNLIQLSVILQGKCCICFLIHQQGQQNRRAFFYR